MGTREREKPDTSSLFGLVAFRPRWIVVLLFLTATVAVFAVRIYRDTGSSRVELLARVGLRLYGSPGWRGGASLDPDDAEKTVAGWIGTPVRLPRGDAVVLTAVRREKVGRRAAAAIRLVESEDDYLLLVVRNRRRASDEAGLFSGAGFLSGETGGKSFVYWERGEAAFFLVTSADRARAVELVRKYFT
ncbi:MAG: hypothetical protein Kow00128_14010 [Deltaproteobacteria bacterium]